jgi:hypothetical protein
MGTARRYPEANGMRPERIELSTSGLKDRRSLGLVKTPLTTELRALNPCTGKYAGLRDRTSWR